MRLVLEVSSSGRALRTAALVLADAAVCALRLGELGLAVRLAERSALYARRADAGVRVGLRDRPLVCLRLRDRR
jgi:hypothetical protein